MSELHLLVDGMLSGTGIRDAAHGGYLEPREIGLSDALRERISAWLPAYEDAHFREYGDPQACEALDREGCEIARQVREELPNAKVGYFSDAGMRRMKL